KLCFGLHTKRSFASVSFAMVHHCTHRVALTRPLQDPPADPPKKEKKAKKEKERNEENASPDSALIEPIPPPGHKKPSDGGRKASKGNVEAIQSEVPGTQSSCLHGYCA